MNQVKLLSTKKIHSFRIVVLSTILTGMLNSSLSRAETENNSNSHQAKTTLQVIQDRLRVRTFSEIMSPAFQGNPTSVPDEDGSTILPTNAFNIAWMDYEVAKDWRVVYWQRFNVNFASTSQGNGLHTVARNPRFALRRTNLFSNPNISSTYDIYIQPGLAPEATTAGRTVEGGFRTNTSYTFPKSRWSMGAITEFTLSKDTAASYYGWIMSWASYDLNPTFSTQHYITVNFLNQKSKAAHHLDWDAPMPFMQNGIGVNVSKSIWTSFFINNYLMTAPTLKNTWASMWVAFTFL